MRSVIRTLLLVTTVAISGLDSKVFAGGADKMTASQLEHRGEELRNAIATRYSQLVQSAKLQPGENDISDVVREYIIAGMSFDDAVTLLHSAGFNFEPLPPRPVPDKPPPWTYKDEDRFLLIAVEIVDSSASRSVNCVITLTPESTESQPYITKSAAGFIRGISL